MYVSRVFISVCALLVYLLLCLVLVVTNLLPTCCYWLSLFVCLLPNCYHWSLLVIIGVMMLFMCDLFASLRCLVTNKSSMRR